MNRRTFLGGAASTAMTLPLFSLVPSKIAHAEATPDFAPDTPEGEIESALSKAGEEVKQQYEKLAREFTEILEDKEQREELLQNMGGKLITLGANAPHVYPFAQLMYDLTKMALNPSMIPRKDLQPSRAGESLKPENKMGLTDATHHGTKQLAEYRNLGVIHDSRMWNEQRDFVLSTIQQSDIVLLERGDEPGWFSQLKKYSYKIGKEARYIGESGGGVTVATIANILALWCVVDMLQLNPLKQIERNAWTKKLAKAWVYQQLGMWPVTSELESRVRDRTSSDAYRGRFSFDYVKDVRTLWMLLEIQKARRNPANLNKKILSITGDQHAKGFELYQDKNAEVLLKRILYDVVFCLHNAANFATKRKD